MLGLGTMIHMLKGGSKKNASSFYGKKIKEVYFGYPDGLHITFDDNVEIRVFDDGQSCCESRYMTTDDDPNSLIGQTLTRIDVKDGSYEDGDEVHETAFLEIGTDQGFITIVTHNEHNGYYGGFGLSIKRVN